MDGVIDRLAAEGAALDACVRQILDVATCGEDSMARACSGFRRLSETTRDLAEGVQRIAATASHVPVGDTTRPVAEVFADMEETIDTLIAGVIETAKQGVSLANVLDDVLRDLDAMTDIIREVDDVNRQTNFLALNAAIEAHRAGVHGRTFAVVAQEVRALSRATADLATRIRSRMNSVVAGVRKGHRVLYDFGSVDLTPQVDARERVGQATRGLLAQNARLQTVLGDVAARSGQVSDDISSTVVQLQFQDRSKQVLLAVAATLTRLAHGQTPASITGVREDLVRTLLAGGTEPMTTGGQGAADTGTTDGAGGDIELF